ncbi:hypothetical protein K0M31_012036 [Melipona bicolor]|uniref:Uncharacterized protein n=1 Tax=Melipona bicolor TaxID=60889 RepID=A0AA40KVK4_9HYME|nr:hypothetical protein K0M31_012036 [Melipona bicolor]
MGGGTDVLAEYRPTQAHLSKEWYIAVKVKKGKERKRRAQQQNGGQQQKVPQGRTVTNLI